MKTLYIAQGAPKFEPKTLLQVTIHLFPPHNRSYDVDNRIKPTLDSLTHCGLWSDDRYIRRLTVTAGRPIQDGAIIVEVERFDEDKERENENTVLSWYGLKALSTPKKKKEAKNEQH